MRLDKFLKVSRLIKRRTVANEACDAGRVLINDRPAKASAQVKAGDLLVEMDLDAIKKEGYDPITPVVVTNGDDFIRSVNMAKSGDKIRHGDCLLTIV